MVFFWNPQAVWIRQSRVRSGTHASRVTLDAKHRALVVMSGGPPYSVWETSAAVQRRQDFGGESDPTKIMSDAARRFGPPRSVRELPNKRDVAFCSDAAAGGIVDVEAGCVRHLQIHEVTEVCIYNVGSGLRAEALSQPLRPGLEAIPH